MTPNSFNIQPNPLQNTTLKQDGLIWVTYVEYLTKIISANLKHTLPMLNK